MPSEIVVLLSHHFQLPQPYSAVDTGTTFFSLPSFTFTFFPPSLAKPGTGAGGASRGRLNVYDAIKSSVAQAAILRARVLTLIGPPSLYWPIQRTTAPASRPCIQV